MYQPYASTGQAAGTLQPAAAVIVAFGLVPAALWLWMARAASQGRAWARILIMVLLTLATLQLIESRGIVQVFTNEGGG